MDQPSDDGLNIYLLSNFANKKGFKACFHGVGGDELFGGYPSFKQIPKFQKLKLIPLFLRRLIIITWMTIQFPFQKLNIYCFQICQLLKVI